jgi:serine/threonine protein kinase
MSIRDERDPDEQATAGVETPPSEAGSSPTRIVVPENELLLPLSGIGSGLLARQPTPQADDTIAVAKLCPQCGSEYETGDRFCPKDGSPLRPKAGGDPLIGRVIADRYLVLARLGEGGMGRVYLAEHVKMTRQCAIKVMNPSLMNDAESLARFAREASSAARILHPNVAAVFDYGEADKVVYLVMEYVDGESLSTILQGGALDPRRAIDIARQIADGLSAAHELGIVHRDLKPDNVIVASSRSGKETPKVVDFGIAKALSDAPQDALTRSGLVIGTPEYMSPEQLLGDPVDARADIYSLGCILYQMLTGVQPFAAESREQMIRRRLHEGPPHVRDVLPALPRRLDTLIVHMLARSSGDRLSSAAEARDALDPALALGGWDPSAITGPRPTPPSHDRRIPTDPSLQPTMPMPRQQPKVRRLVVAGVVTLVVAGSLIYRSQSGEASHPVAPIGAQAETPVNRTKKQPSTGSGAPIRAESPPMFAAPPPKPKAKPDSATLENAQIRTLIDGFAAATQRHSTASVLKAAPPIAAAAEKNLEAYFARGENFKASTSGVDISAHSDSATASFKLMLKFNDRTGAKASEAQSFQYHAEFARHGKRWSFTKLRER